ncbi:hypothetical protein HOF78_00935 [Candidatus Woesearchaeota archaeon]|jgi:hypothetical protein|nr:hypothetical protein [Candidatus Woesearchaeota archaeon]MBT6045049.1 hypothetical protein [Candidatus Woesearchaeota archaeon]
MNFRKDFTNIEGDGVLDTHGVALKTAMEGSSEWKSHVSNCKDAKVNFLSVGGERIITNDERSKLFDEEIWRKGLEEKSKMMLSGDRKGFDKKSEDTLKSENFNLGSTFDSEKYEKQLLSVGCMCGVEVNLDSVSVDGSYSVSSSVGSYLTSDKKGTMTYE